MRTLASVAVVTLLLASVPVRSAEAMLFSDDFSAALIGYEEFEEEGRIDVEEGRLRMVRPSVSEGHAEIRRALPEFDRAGTFGLSADFMVPHEDNHWFYVLHGAGGSLVLDWETGLTWYNGVENIPLADLEPGVWYRVGFCTDGSAGITRIALDGVGIAELTPMDRAYPATLRIGEPVDGGFNYGEGYWDNLAFVTGCRLAPFEPVANDERAAATPLEHNFGDVARMEHATLAEGETVPCGPSGNSVWYRLTAIEDVRVTFFAGSEESPTTIAVYAGSGTTPLSVVTCVDAEAGYVHAAEFPATANVTYWIQVVGERDGYVYSYLTPEDRPAGTISIVTGEDGSPELRDAFDPHRFLAGDEAWLEAEGRSVLVSLP